MSINHWLHELADPWDCVVRDLGEGSVRLICWGSVNANPAYLVRLYGSGRLVVVDQSDLTIAGNPGDPRDNPPKDRIKASSVVERGELNEPFYGDAEDRFVRFSYPTARPNDKTWEVAPTPDGPWRYSDALNAQYAKRVVEGVEP